MEVGRSLNHLKVITDTQNEEGRFTLSNFGSSSCAGFSTD